MSSYLRTTKHPKTGNWETAQWLDDHFGPHQYGVKFEDGTIITPDFTKNFPESRDDLPEKGWDWQERKEPELTVPTPQNDELTPLDPWSEILKKYTASNFLAPVTKPDPMPAEVALAAFKALARKEVASEIFDLAHQYAQNDNTTRGPEELRSYHYYNAIHTIGGFSDR